MEGTVKIDILKFPKGYRKTTQLAFWPAALLCRTSVLPQAKPRRMGGFADPEHSEPKIKGHLQSRFPFILVEQYRS